MAQVPDITDDCIVVFYEDGTNSGPVKWADLDVLEDGIKNYLVVSLFHRHPDSVPGDPNNQPSFRDNFNGDDIVSLRCLADGRIKVCVHQDPPGLSSSKEHIQEPDGGNNQQIDRGDRARHSIHSAQQVRLYTADTSDPNYEANVQAAIDDTTVGPCLF